MYSQCKKYSYSDQVKVKLCISINHYFSMFVEYILYEQNFIPFNIYKNINKNR